MKINNHDARCIDWYRRLIADGTAEDGQRIAVEMHDKLKAAEEAIETICIEGLHQNCDLCMQFCECSGPDCNPKYKL